MVKSGKQVGWTPSLKADCICGCDEPRLLDVRADNAHNVRAPDACLPHTAHGLLGTSAPCSELLVTQTFTPSPTSPLRLKSLFVEAITIDTTHTHKPHEGNLCLL